MSRAKVAITIDHELLGELDRMVKKRIFASRSEAIQVAVREKVQRLSRRRMAEEAAKLDPKEEQAWAEEGFAAGVEEWPEY
jgi:metal-responsive CopG/Arc/MetJ family transcriptional regulator